MTLPDFYRTQTSFSDPGPHAALYDALPDDIDGQGRVVRGLYVHYLSGKRIAARRKAEVDLRYTAAILERVITHDPRPLTEARPVGKRVVGCCRDAALLLCSMLRHKGVPARIRVGFATYIHLSETPFNVDHVVTEYWNVDQGRWLLVDAEQDAALIQHNRIDFDVHDIPRDKFLVGGAAWQQCRAGIADPQQFGAAPGDFFAGWWAIRNRLLHDLSTLNKVELLLWDTWGWLDYGFQPTDDDLKTLDDLAALTQSDDFTTIRDRYTTDARFTAPEVVMCYSPVAEWSEIRPVYTLSE